ncbi:MAG: hypothetical protein RLZZ600_719 [Actinomycetota bacterium]|jgi:hypothetical protein
MTDKHMFGSSDHADSAGQPWAGRSFEPNAFADDDGSAPVEFIAAMKEFRSHEYLSTERAEAHARAIEVIKSSRLLAPLVAEAGDIGFTEEGLKVDKTQELALVYVAGPNGEKTLPVFSNVATMYAWNPDARPIPVDGLRVAASVIHDGAEMVVIDPGDVSEIAIRIKTLEAMVAGRAWVPPQIDSEIIAAFKDSADGQVFVRGVRLIAGDPDARGIENELVVQISLVPNLAQDQVVQQIEQLSNRWLLADVIAERVTSMTVQVIPAAS